MMTIRSYKIRPKRSMRNLMVLGKRLGGIRLLGGRMRMLWMVELRSRRLS